MFSKRCKNNLSWEWIITFWENVNWLWLNDWHYMYYIMNQLTLFVCWAFASSSSLTSSHKRNSRSSSRWTCSVLMLSVIAHRRGLFSEQCSHINCQQLAGPLVSICQLLVSPQYQIKWMEYTWRRLPWHLLCSTNRELSKGSREWHRILLQFCRPVEKEGWGKW